uniref:rRNA N-glycosylase n=1 Tax=Hordeum vulgare subsp. vulgare TaxID=112509 RepID=A0A8I6X8K1_HORVV
MPRTTTGAMVSVLLMLVILVVRATAGAVAVDVVPWSVPSESLEIDFESMQTGYQYTQIEEVYNRVVGLSRYNAYGKPVMAKQTGEGQPPPKWLHLVARGHGTEVTTLALRQDNLYLAGFTDKSGSWYTFANKARHNLIPGATADQGCLARGVAVIVLTVCEANRLQPIFNAIRANWVAGGFLPYPVYRYVVNWKTVSCALMVAVQHGNQWDLEKDEARALKTELSIGSLPAAANAAFLLLCPDKEMCSEKINWLK